MRMTRTIAILALTCTPLLAAAPAPKSKPGTDPKKKDEAPVVFTNKSLDDLPPPTPPTSLPDVVVAPGASADADGPVVITNEMLDKLVGPAPAPPAPAGNAKTTAPPPDGAPTPPALDPLAAMQKEKEDAAKRQEAAATAQTDVATAETKVNELQKRLLAEHNPFLPRPTLTPDEQAKQAGLDGAARVQQTQEQLDLAKKDLERAREQAGQGSPQR